MSKPDSADHQDDDLRLFDEAFEAEESGALDKAIELYTLLGERDFTPAQVNLGNIYDDSLNPPDPNKAIYWYRRAADLQSGAGAWCLAVHYKKLGEIFAYRRWLKTAAKLGDEEAKAELARGRLSGG